MTCTAARAWTSFMAGLATTVSTSARRTAATSSTSKSDTIYDFNQSEGDEIWLKGSYTYAGNTAAPADGQYSVWTKGGDYVVTWNAAGDAGYHDVIVKGDNPQGDISFY